MTWHVRKGKGCLIVDPSSAIDGGLVREKNDRTLEARATHFSTWLSRNGYTYQSPASLSPGAGIATLGLFLMSVATGDNIHQCSNLCTKTLAGYLRAASAYLEDVTHQTIPLYNEHKTVHPLLAEVLAQRAAWREPLSKKEPLTSTTLHHMHHITQHAFQQDQTSFLDKSAALLDWIWLGIQTGSRLGEYGQSTLSGNHPSNFTKVPDTPDAGIWTGTPIAFLTSDFTFFDANGTKLDHPSVLHPTPATLPTQVHIRFHFDKSPTNFTIRKFNRLSGCFLCPVKAVLSILYRATALHIPPHHPIGAYHCSQVGDYHYINGNDMSSYMQHACELSYSDANHYLHIHVKQLMAHSLRVTACVALHQAGVPAEDIAFHLRWNIESVKFYLRDCSCDIGSFLIQAVHNAYRP